LYDDAPEVDLAFWRSFRDVLYVYLPTMEYIFALKVAAYRLRDKDDIHFLIQQLQLQRREQAEAIIEKFLLPEARAFWEVEDKLDDLFP
jgi:hypothetical protein